MSKLDRRSFIKKTSLSGAALASSTLFTGSSQKKNFTKSPFSDLDILATNDWWNRSDNEIINLKVKRDKVIAFGIYTLSNKTVKLTSQLFPLYPEESRDITLEINKNGKWEKIKTNIVNEIGWSTTFKITDWDDSKDVKYRLSHGLGAEFIGLIRKNPTEKESIVLAAFSCNSNKDRGDRNNYINNINHINLEEYYYGNIPRSDSTNKIDKQVLEEVKIFKNQIMISLNNFKFREALKNLMNIARLGNKYLADNEPWKIKNDNPERVKEILNVSFIIVSYLAILSEPFIPFTSIKLKNMIGIKEFDWDELDNL